MKDPRDLLVALLGRVPLAAADGLAWVLAWTWWWLVPIRRGVAVHNLALALPGEAPRPALTRMMHDLVLGYLELARFDLDRARGRASEVRVEIERGAMPDGALVLGGHGGSWDLALLASAHRIPVAIYLKTPADPWTRRWLTEVRTRHGVEGLLTGAGMAEGYAALERGRCLYFIQDQRFNRGLVVPLFGHPAKTSAGFAAAALRTGRPTWGAWPVRLGRGHHRVLYRPLPLPPPTGDAEADTLAATAAANRFYEECIREHPHGWLWLHKRWG